jgi:catalase
MPSTRLPRSSGIPLTLAAALGVSAIACGSSPHVAAPARAPNDEPADPLEWSGSEAMNTEFYMGTRDEELTELRRFAAEINEIQTKQARDHEQPIQRGFHAKAHGCLWGHMNLWPNRDPRTRFGIFSDAYQSHPVWVRYSNGVGWSQHDKDLDARGMAVKVMNVPGKKYADESATQDFLMTNSPTPVGKNGEEFMSFAHANASGRFPSLLFLITHPRSGAPALLRTDAVPSAVTEQYWSGAAYHLGAHQAIKYTTKPCEGSPSRTPSKKEDDYLREDLKHAANRLEGICYTFYVQFQIDPDRTPIENAAKQWDEKVSPLVRVADIVMPSQEFDSPKQRAFCTSLSYNPWHAMPAHKPMGHINRARRFVYEASRAYRHGGHEPTDFEGFGPPLASTATASPPPTP